LIDSSFRRVFGLRAFALVGALVALSQSLTAATPIRIVLAGDSTAMSYATVRPPRTGWGQVLDRFVDFPVILMGTTGRQRASQSVIAFGAAASELLPGDLFLLQLQTRQGANAIAASSGPDDATLAALRRLLAAARMAGARPVLVTPVARREFDASGHAVDVHGEAVGALKALAKQEGLPVLDLNRHSLSWLEALGSEASKSWYFQDPATGFADLADLHERGAVSIACLLIAELVEQKFIAASLVRRPLECALTPDQNAGDARRLESGVEHVDSIRQDSQNAYGSSGLAIAATLFSSAQELPMTIQRLVLHDGATLGVHRHGHEEVLYVIDGRAELTLDGGAQLIGPGSAVLVRPGSIHSLRQIGAEDLRLLSIRANGAPKDALVPR